MQEVEEIIFLDVEEDEKLKKFIENIVQTCFKVENLLDLNFYLSITLTTPEQIHVLNKEYRNVDRATDVLSFPMFEKNEIDELVQNQNNVVEDVLGDIIISVDRVKEQAVEYGHSFERELAYMVVHGFYHLMGYDHMNDDEKSVMRAKEENILSKLKITR